MGVISTNVHITSRGTTLQGGSLPFCAGIGGCSATWITWCRLTDWGDVVDEMIRHVMHMYMIMCNYIYIFIYLFIFWGGVFSGGIFQPRWIPDQTSFSRSQAETLGFSASAASAGSAGSAETRSGVEALQGTRAEWWGFKGKP